MLPEITTIQIRDDDKLCNNLKEMFWLSPVNIPYLYNTGRELCIACTPTYTELFYGEKKKKNTTVFRTPAVLAL